MKGPIAWMARNSVAANLLMLVCFAGGTAGLISIKTEVFPEFDLDVVNVTVPYPGASPVEVEQGIVLAVEEAVRGLDGVKRVNSVAAENAGNISVELLLGEDPERALSDVKNAVDRITSFPEEAEEPTVAIASRKREVISLVIAGDQELATLHAIAEKARAALLASEEITQVELSGVPPLEVSIEVPRETLESLGMTLPQIAGQVAAASVELPGGEIETRQGEILLRLADRRRSGAEFADIIVRSTQNGYEVRLGDIATIKDTYADTDEAAFYDGRSAVRVTAYRTGDETPMGVADAVRAYRDELAAELPPEVTLAVWNDDSQILRSRLDLLARNARLGFFLVLLVLGLFLKPRLAGWVALGIPISFFGALALLPAADVSINMVTTFAFIVTLGLVVDDAIVVGENIYQKMEAGLGAAEAAVAGAREMAVPVTFSVLTTVAAFSPLFFVPGVMGKIFSFIPMVVVAVLMISLFESFLILPAHLGHEQKWAWVGVLLSPLERVQTRIGQGLTRFITKFYKPVVITIVRWRYVTFATAVAMFLVTIGAVGSGLVPFNFFPKLEGDVVVASARLPYGAPIERTTVVGEALEKAAKETVEEFGGDAIVRGVWTTVGRGPRARGPGPAAQELGSHLVTIEVNLVESSERSFSAHTFASKWEQAMPKLAGIEALTISAAAGPGAGAAVDVQLTHDNSDVLAVASESLTETLRGYEALTNVENGYAAGKPQLDFHLAPQARMLGLNGADVARQLRSSFFGAEALREQRGRNEVKVMVRLPEAQRRSEFDLESLYVGTPTGGRVPLEYVARLERGRSPTAIIREEGRRVVNVSGDLAAGVVSPQEVLDALRSDVLPKLTAENPGLGATLVGAQRSRAETFASLRVNAVLAMFVIFAMLAIPFKSYIQPAIVMSVVPFGFVGAVIGHALMGYELSMISILGIVALSGVVVNDSLVLIDTTNRLVRDDGVAPNSAIVGGAIKRFRPILLTSLTTFFGLAPMILETSRQARFLIPMAISSSASSSKTKSTTATSSSSSVKWLSDKEGSRQGRTPTVPRRRGSSPPIPAGPRT